MERRERRIQIIHENATKIDVDLSAISSVIRFIKPEEINNRVHEICERYAAIIAREMPELSFDEWICIINATSGSYVNTDLAVNIHHSLADAAADYEDSEAYISTARKIGQMPLGSRIAIIEILDRVANRDSDETKGDLENDLIRFGVRFKSEL